MLTPTTDLDDIIFLELVDPAGVPVAMRSPGSSVMTPEMYDTRNGMENAISAALPCCRFLR
jgi:hypothetical protein